MDGSKGKYRGPMQLYVEDEGWFVDGDNGRLGPFDCVYEICMSTCFLGGSICEFTELSGEAMTEFLWPLMADR